MRFNDHHEKANNGPSASSMHTATAPPRTLEDAYGLIKEMKGSIEQLEARLRDYAHHNRVLRQIAYHISSRKDLSLLYEDIVTAVMREVPSEGGFLMRAGRGRLETRYYAGTVNEITLRVMESSAFFGDLLRRDEAVRVGSREENLLNAAFAGTHTRIRSILCVPLKTHSDTIPFGILGLLNHTGGADFTESHDQFLSLVAIEASVAIRNLEYFSLSVTTLETLSISFRSSSSETLRENSSALRSLVALFSFFLKSSRLICFLCFSSSCTTLPAALSSGAATSESSHSTLELIGALCGNASVRKLPGEDTDDTAAVIMSCRSTRMNYTVSELSEQSSQLPAPCGGGRRRNCRSSDTF